jgi:hypothetical protein
MQAPKAPAAPDPKVTAQTQSAGNVATATAQNTMGMVDKFGPTGSETYKVTEYLDQPDGFGGTMRVPRYAQTTTLTPEQQAIFNTGQQTEQNIATIGRDQSARIGDLLGKPIQMGNEATEARLMELGSSRLNPVFQRDEEALRTRLANSGIRAGTAAFDAEMGQFNQRRNDAYNQLLLSGRAQANQELLTERNQPINEITALLSGSQVSMPQFNNPQTANLAGVDYSGLVRDKYNAELAAYNSRVNSQNAMMGGLFGLAGTLGAAGIRYSDTRLKSKIRRVGKHRSGLTLYAYDIFGRREIGVMAQEALAAFPHAVSQDNVTGWLMVDYERLAA